MPVCRLTGPKYCFWKIIILCSNGFEYFLVDLLSLNFAKIARFQGNHFCKKTNFGQNNNYNDWLILSEWVLCVCVGAETHFRIGLYLMIKQKHGLIGLYLTISSPPLTIKKGGREPWSIGYGRRLMFWRSWVRIPAPFFPHLFVVKIRIVCLKRPKINEKEAGVGPFLKKNN